MPITKTTIPIKEMPIIEITVIQPLLAKLPNPKENPRAPKAIIHPKPPIKRPHPLQPIQPETAPQQEEIPLPKLAPKCPCPRQ